MSLPCLPGCFLPETAGRTIPLGYSVEHIFTNKNKSDNIPALLGPPPIPEPETMDKNDQKLDHLHHTAMPLCCSGVRLCWDFYSVLSLLCWAWQLLFFSTTFWSCIISFPFLEQGTHSDGLSLTAPFRGAASWGCIHNPAMFATSWAVFWEDQKAQAKTRKGGVCRGWSWQPILGRDGNKMV